MGNDSESGRQSNTEKLTDNTAYERTVYLLNIPCSFNRTPFTFRDTHFCKCAAPASPTDSGVGRPPPLWPQRLVLEWAHDPKDLPVPFS